jgi:hypothetical protein
METTKKKIAHHRRNKKVTLKNLEKTRTGWAREAPRHVNALAFAHTFIHFISATCQKGFCLV